MPIEYQKIKVKGAHKVPRKGAYKLEYPNDTKEWILNGKYHRENGPAVEYASGDKYWLLNNKLHREDGPAIEWNNGSGAWYLNDTMYNEKDFWYELYKSGKISKEEYFIKCL